MTDYDNFVYLLEINGFVNYYTDLGYATSIWSKNDNNICVVEINKDNVIAIVVIHNIIFKDINYAKEYFIKHFVGDSKMVINDKYNLP